MAKGFEKKYLRVTPKPLSRGRIIAFPFVYFDSRLFITPYLRTRTRPVTTTLMRARGNMNFHPNFMI